MALQIEISSTPTAIILWQSCATVEAKAPFFKPKFLIKAMAGFACSSYRLITTIFKISLSESHTNKPFSNFACAYKQLVISCPSIASIIFICGNSVSAFNAKSVAVLCVALKLLIAFGSVCCKSFFHLLLLNFHQYRFEGC